MRRFPTEDEQSIPTLTSIPPLGPEHRHVEARNLHRRGDSTPPVATPFRFSIRHQADESTRIVRSAERFQSCTLN